MSDKQWDSPPAMQIDPQKTYRVTIETNRGVIELELYPEYFKLEMLSGFKLIEDNLALIYLIFVYLKKEKVQFLENH